MHTREDPNLKATEIVWPAFAAGIQKYQPVGCFQVCDYLGMPLVPRADVVGVEKAVNPSGIDGGQFLLQALGNLDILMRIADEYVHVAEIFCDFVVFQNTCFGHGRLPLTS